MTDCNLGILLEPRALEPRLRRATAFRSLGRLLEAVEAYREVLGMEPNCQEAKQGMQEAEKIFVRPISSIDIDTKLKQDNHKVYNTLLEKLHNSSIEDILQQCTGVVKVALIIVLKVLFPSMSKDLQSLTSTPLHPFQSPNNALVYVQDLIESGAFSETREMIYILGRNEIGKTSLLRTLKKFAEDPNQSIPTHILTESKDYQKLQKTEVAEIHKDVKLDATLHGGKIQAIQEEDLEKDGEVMLVKLSKESPEEDIETCHPNIVDFGGHVVYLACAPVLLQKQGITLVCFDSTRIQGVEDVGTKYYGEIGRFLDLVCEQERSNLKIMLVATKSDLNLLSQEVTDTILTQTKEHLNRLLTGDNHLTAPVFLVDHIEKTSLKTPGGLTRDGLKDFWKKLATLMASPGLGNSQVVVPRKWKDWLGGVREKPLVSRKDLKLEKGKGTQNVLSEDDIETLEKLKVIVVEAQRLDRQEQEQMQEQEQIQKQKHEHEQKLQQEKTHKQEQKKEHIQKQEQKQEHQQKPEQEQKQKQELEQKREKIQLPEPESNKEERIEQEKKRKEEEKQKQELNLRLEFFKTTTEILWFTDVLDLKEDIITNPDYLIESLKIILHYDLSKIVEDEPPNASDVKSEKRSREIEVFKQKGWLSKGSFIEIFNKKNEKKEKANTLSAEETWKFLTKLNIASLSDNEGEAGVMLPGILAGEYQPEQNKCSICLKAPDVSGDISDPVEPDNNQESEDPVYLACGHLFCSGHLDQWHASDNTNADKCPECRTRLTTAKPAYGATGKIPFIIHMHIDMFYVCRF